MKKSETPGMEGIAIEFYQSLWNLLGHLVKKSLNEGYENEMLATSKRKAALTLIYKKGDPESLENWRAISILNNDLKIGAYALAK